MLFVLPTGISACRIGQGLISQDKYLVFIADGTPEISIPPDL